MPVTSRGATRSVRDASTLRSSDTSKPCVGSGRIAVQLSVEAVRARGQRGFTLLEVMVVVVILGILAALVVPKIISRPDEARAIAAKQDIASLMQALKLYRLDNQRYPTTEQGLQALVARPASAPLRAQLEGRRLCRAPAEGPLGQSLPVPQSRRARRDRRVQHRRRRRARRRGQRCRYRLLEPLAGCAPTGRDGTCGFTANRAARRAAHHAGCRACRAGRQRSSRGPTSARCCASRPSGWRSCSISPTAESRLTGRPIAWTADAARYRFWRWREDAGWIRSARTMRCARAACRRA